MEYFIRNYKIWDAFLDANQGGQVIEEAKERN